LKKTVSAPQNFSQQEDYLAPKKKQQADDGDKSKVLFSSNGEDEAGWQGKYQKVKI